MRILRRSDCSFQGNLPRFFVMLFTTIGLFIDDDLLFDYLYTKLPIIRLIEGLNEMIMP